MIVTGLSLGAGRESPIETIMPLSIKISFVDPLSGAWGSEMSACLIKIFIEK
jgi:hypothetical protein